MTTPTTTWQSGDHVEVATRPAPGSNPNWPGRYPTTRDNTSLWGFAYDEWRPAVITDTPRAGFGYSVRFFNEAGEPDGPQWGFAVHEIRRPMPAGHARSQSEVMRLAAGQQLSTPDGPTVILKTGRVHDAGSGSYACRLVVRTLPHNEFHPFVVHTAIYQDDEPLQESPLAGRWVFEQGDYARTIEEALEAFARRES